MPPPDGDEDAPRQPHVVQKIHTAASRARTPPETLM